MEKTIYWFEELGKDSLLIAGGKGANLGEMTQLGFPVPPGFAVPVSAYYTAIKANSLHEPISAILEKLTDLEDSDALDAASKAVKNLILEAPVPPTIETSIAEAYEKLCVMAGIPDVLVAIRSSATAEDLPTASFAGQQATFLNIQGARNVIQAVRECWASLFEARAIYYRVRHGFDHMRVGLCAVVQQMVQSKVSGVMFTADPVTGRRDRIIIEAGLGLGEAIVSGLINPDMYVLNHKDASIITKSISEQTIGIFMLHDGQTKEDKILKPQQKMQKLPDEHILGLGRIGINIEKAYGGKPQDIEWALDDQGRLFIVQTRAITTLEKEEPVMKTEEEVEKSVEGQMLVKGLPASPGMSTGIVKMIKNRRDLAKVQPGDIIVAHMTSPDYVPVMKRSGGIITDAGGMTCHAAIVARELGIPCIVGTGNATSALKNGIAVTIDANTGIVYAGNGLVTGKKTEQRKADSSPIITTSHPFVPITATKLYVNIADPDVAERVAKDPNSADGVGLIRAEFMISALGTHPNLLAKQGKSEIFISALAENLRRIAAAFNPRPVIYRANDFKSNEYRGLPGGDEFEPTHEENPMIGFRGCLRYVTDSTVFMMELAAIKKVREEMRLTNIHLMIPFVRTVPEFRQVLELCSGGGLRPNEDGFNVGMMCEVPSNVLLAKEFCQAGAKFMSIGSNDLAQLILGSDRDSALLAPDFDERNPAVLKAIRKVIKKCHRYGVTVSICGQMPSVYPETIQILVDAGIDGISVNPDVLESTRRLLASAEQRLILDKLRSTN